MLKKLIGPIGQSVMAAIIMCSTSGAINSNILETPRVAFAMGRDGVFFRGLGIVHVVYRTPVPAILVTAFMSVGWLMAAAVGKALVAGVVPSTAGSDLGRRFIEGLQQNSIFDLLTNFVVFASALFHTFTVLAVFLLRWTRPDAPRPYRTWGYPFVPAAFLLINLWFMRQIYLSNPVEAHVGLGLVALGVPVYLLYWRMNSAANDATDRVR
jgi:APA family basic amino acid/polyamine antiporter